MFSEDAIFQGLRPYRVGRPGIIEYYDSRPIGLAAEYDILETRRLTDSVILGCTQVESSFPARPTLNAHPSLIVKPVGDDWRISHYQVSERP